VSSRRPPRAGALLPRFLAALLILPGTVLIVVPGAILWLTRGGAWAADAPGPGDGRFWLALVLLGAGLALAAWTSGLFLSRGQGTPAPWDPPQRLVVRGPYRHVRNPMITAVLLLLLAEALWFRSWPIAVWFAVFCAGNAVYFPLVEEPGLERRFGAAYQAYKAAVPRWIPRLRPWSPP